MRKFCLVTVNLSNITQIVAKRVWKKKTWYFKHTFTATSYTPVFFTYDPPGSHSTSPPTVVQPEEKKTLA